MILMSKHDPMYASMLHAPRDVLAALEALAYEYRNNGETNKTCHIIDAQLCGEYKEFIVVAAYFAPNDDREGGYGTFAYHVDGVERELCGDHFGHGPVARNAAKAGIHDFVVDLASN